MNSKKIWASLSLLFVSTPLLAAAGTVNWSDLVLKTVNFAVLVSVLTFLIVKPLARWLNQQLNARQQDWDKHQVARKLARQRLDEQQKRFYKMDEKIQQLKEESAQQAEHFRQQILQEYQVQTASLKNQFEERARQYQLAKQQSLQQLLLQQVHQLTLQKVEANKKHINHPFLVERFTKQVGKL